MPGAPHTPQGSLPPNPPRITRLTESDWRPFAGIRLRALGEAFGEDDPHYQLEARFTAADWRRRLRDHAHFAALLGERPVGLIVAQRQTAESVYLYSLWLDPNARGQGLGRGLVATALDWARRHRARNVSLRVATDNVAARAVYESFGFAKVTDSGDPGELMLSLSVG